MPRRHRRQPEQRGPLARGDQRLEDQAGQEGRLQEERDQHGLAAQATRSN